MDTDETRIGHERFLALLFDEFPELATKIKDEGIGLLHLEVAAFRRATEQAMDSGQLWIAEKHFRFVDRVIREACPDVVNALGVSYLEDLALGDCTPERHRAVKERMPPQMRDEMVAIEPSWR